MLVHKHVAHLTITRPLPEDKNIYRPSGYVQVVSDMVTLFEQFTQVVNPRLLPEWWTDRVAPLRAQLVLDV
jgi:hypothetical protein